MPAPNQPTLLYPVGGEKIDSPSVNVRWEEPTGAASSVAFVEIRVGQGGDIFDDSRSYLIGRTVAGVGSFTWNVNSSFSGSNLRISVRLVAPDGSRSAASVSYDDFSIVRLTLPTPVVINPKPNSVISSKALIVFDDAPYTSFGNARVQYSIYASSESANAFYIPVAENIPVGTPALSWSVDGLRNASDWYINVFAADDSGVRSSTINIGPLTLGDPGFIIFDTEPPDIVVRVQSDEFYTRVRDISMQVYADDDATSVHAMKIVEKAKTPEGTYIKRSESAPKEYSSDIIFKLFDQDERKFLSIFAQDFGANRSDMSNVRDFYSTKKPNFFRELLKLPNGSIFRTVRYEDGGNRFIAAIASSLSSQDIVVSIDNMGITTLCTSGMPVVALGIEGINVYASLANSTRSMDVRLIVGGVLVEKFSDTTFGSEVTAIGSDAFGNLFMGCADGRLFSKSGSTLSRIGQLSGTVTSIVRGNGGSVFVCAGNSNNIYIANPSGVIIMEVTI